jgi:hypothetical protein
MSNLPAAPRAFAVQRVAREQHQAGVTVVRHAIQESMLAEIDRIDGQALGDALKASLDEEVGLLDYGQQLAGDNPAAAVLVLRKVQLASAVNNRRIQSRFGA